MKLRNKRTNEIGYFNYMQRANGGGIILTVMIGGGPKMFRYDSLAKLNEEWEDYKQKEPLIKDEKVRNLVRDWAHNIGILRVEYHHKEDYDTFYASVREENRMIAFALDTKHINDGLIDGKEYTIAELCGEEE